MIRTRDWLPRWKSAPPASEGLRYGWESRLTWPDDTSRTVIGSVIESGAGEGAGFPDGAYRKAGCEVVGSAWGADVVVTVVPPDAEERSRLLPGALLVGLLRPLDEPEQMRELARTGVTSIGFRNPCPGPLALRRWTCCRRRPRWLGTGWRWRRLPACVGSSR